MTLPEPVETGKVIDAVASRPTTPERIAAAAERILLDEGVSAVTMRRVATEVGLSTMATYRHFPNREALLHALADAASVELVDKWRQRESEPDALARLHGLREDFLDFALGKPHLYRYVMTERRPAARRFPDDFRTEVSSAFVPVVRAVEAGMQQGVLRQDDPLEVALAITSQTQGLVQLYLGDRIGLSETDFRALCARTMERTLRGTRS